MSNYKDAYYFPHDSNAKDDPKCVLLIEQLGMEGYGIYWMLIEILRDQPDYSYPVANIPALARRYNTTVEKVKTVVYNYSLFTVIEDRIFFSESLNRRMAIVNEARKQKVDAGRAGALKRWNNDTAIASLSQSHSTAIAIKEKDIITEDIKEEENIRENINLRELPTASVSTSLSTASVSDPNYLKFIDWVRANAPRVLDMPKFFTELEFQRAKAKMGHEKMCELLQEMHNWIPLEKNISAYATLINWYKRQEADNNSSANKDYRINSKLCSDYETDIS